MSHLDTFAPQIDNPKLMHDVKAIPTSADGVVLSENLPLTAQHMHNASIIKTMVSSQGAHHAGKLSHAYELSAKRYNCSPNFRFMGSQTLRADQPHNSDEC